MGAGQEAVGLHSFLAEVERIGFTPTGADDPVNELYIGTEGGVVEPDQTGTVLGELAKFRQEGDAYDGFFSPDCMSVPGSAFLEAGRMDPKFFLFKRLGDSERPDGWVTERVGKALSRRKELFEPEGKLDDLFNVLTIRQTGEIVPREPGKANAPPEWLGSYFSESSSKWYQVKAGDLVFSKIDLWKGCIGIVPDHLDGALVTNDFPAYSIKDPRLMPEFLSVLLRSPYYQRAFRAITTGHSNRRRTQEGDFEDLEISFPATLKEQKELIADISRARQERRLAMRDLKEALQTFGDIIEPRPTS